MSKRRLTTKEFIRRARKIHGDRYRYSNVKYVNSTTKVVIECAVPGHKKFEQTPQGHLSGRGCQKCGRNKKMFLPYAQLQAEVRRLGITLQEEYIKMYRQIPGAPSTLKANYKEWESWPKFLGTPLRRTLIADSGLICPSENHTRIENFFHAHGIKREPNYRYGPFVADWKLSYLNTLVEYFGMQKGSGYVNKAYRKKTEKKKAYCKRHNLILVAIYSQDVAEPGRLEELFRDVIELSQLERRSVPITTDKQAQQFFEDIEHSTVFT